MDVVDLETADQGKTLLAAEEIGGEYVVARTLVTFWTEENNDTFCWFNDCYTCGVELKEGERGFVWGKPFGTLAALQVYCSEECVEKAIREWAQDSDASLMIGYYTM